MQSIFISQDNTISRKSKSIEPYRVWQRPAMHGLAKHGNQPQGKDIKITLITESTVADLYGVTTQTIRNWRGNGKLPANLYTERPILRYDLDALKEFMGFTAAAELKKRKSQQEIIEEVLAEICPKRRQNDTTGADNIPARTQ